MWLRHRLRRPSNHGTYSPIGPIGPIRLIGFSLSCRNRLNRATHEAQVLLILRVRLGRLSQVGDALLGADDFEDAHRFEAGGAVLAAKQAHAGRLGPAAHGLEALA